MKSTDSHMKDVYRMTKGEACRMFEAAEGEEAKSFWAKRIAWLDKKLSVLPKPTESRFKQIRRWVFIVNVLAILSIFLTSCTTVQGIGSDITWMGKAGSEMLREGHKVDFDK